MKQVIILFFIVTAIGAAAREFKVVVQLDQPVQVLRDLRDGAAVKSQP